jgi:hypothetical protein
MAEWHRYKDVSTLELITLMNDKCVKEVSELAFYAFHFRFTTEVMNRCEVVCNRWGYRDDVAILIHKQTFKKFLSGNKFNIEKARNGSDIDKAVLLYLLAISKNELADYHTQITKEPSPYHGEETILSIELLEKLRLRTDLPDEWVIILDVLNEFSDKHAIIFLTYKTYEVAGYKLPRKLLAEMRDKLDIAQATIRSYKNEVHKEISKRLKYE